MTLPAHIPQQPAELWRYFHRITQLPRPSRHEDKIREFILAEAKRRGRETKVDGVGNVIVYVPATQGREKEVPLIVQNHMDMVTDALPEKRIDFTRDPITTFREGDWIKAEGTTLGADNGIGCAAALALMEGAASSHPPLELLFTIDEETGLKGAWGVEPAFLRGKRMLNLDTEEWGSFYIGCAGGIDYEIKGELERAPVPWKKASTLKLMVSGFLGGHSGVDIHEQRGNAIKFLAEILAELPSASFMVHELRGGKAHNIIPRDAWVLVSGEEGLGGALASAVERVKARWKSFLPPNDQAFEAQVTAAEAVADGVTGERLGQLLAFLDAFPHGAHKYDLASGRELVALSNNLALCYLVRDQFYLLTSLRFFDRQECVSLENQVVGLARLAGLTSVKDGEYPSWKPVRENRLLEQMSGVYQSLYGKAPKVTAIHAGLECGILRDKIGPIDAVSFGPTILGAHSPQERVDIPSVEKFWNLLVTALAAI